MLFNSQEKQRKIQINFKSIFQNRKKISKIKKLNPRFKKFKNQENWKKQNFYFIFKKISFSKNWRILEWFLEKSRKKNVFFSDPVSKNVKKRTIIFSIFNFSKIFHTLNLKKIGKNPFFQIPSIFQEPIDNSSVSHRVRLDIRDISNDGHLLSLSVLPYVLIQVNWSTRFIFER